MNKYETIILLILILISIKDKYYPRWTEDERFRGAPPLLLVIAGNMVYLGVFVPLLIFGYALLRLLVFSVFGVYLPFMYS